jgi:polar amino acid transport system substrate-binding protein
MGWLDSLEALKNGSQDIASGATYSKDRAAYVYYSKPYRYEEDGLFILRDEFEQYPFNTVTEFLDLIKKRKFRIGVKKGAITSDGNINDFLSNPEYATHKVTVENDKENIEMLLSKQIDAFITDRIEGASLVLKLDLGKKITEKGLSLKTPIHFIFSKKTQTPEVVDTFNKAIDKLLNESLYNNILSWYLYPTLLLQSMNSQWFQIIDILGTVFFAISGVLIANRLKASLLAGFIYAVLPSLGGGIIRDIIFSQRPVDALSTPLYLIMVCGIVLIGFFFSKIYDYAKSKNLIRKYSHVSKEIYKHFKVALSICDALGLAAFTVTGVFISIKARVEPLWLWGPFFAFLSGALGTIMRDILIKRKRLSEIKGRIYSEIAIVWGLFLSMILLVNIRTIQPETIRNYVIITMVGVFMTRMIIYFTKVHNVYFKK